MWCASELCGSSVNIGWACSMIQMAPMKYLFCSESKGPTGHIKYESPGSKLIIKTKPIIANIFFVIILFL